MFSVKSYLIRYIDVLIQLLFCLAVGADPDAIADLAFGDLFAEKQKRVVEEKTSLAYFLGRCLTYDLLLAQILSETEKLTYHMDLECFVVINRNEKTENHEHRLEQASNISDPVQQRIYTPLYPPPIKANLVDNGYMDVVIEFIRPLALRQHVEYLRLVGFELSQGNGVLQL